MQRLIFRNANGKELDLTSYPYGITNWEGFGADGLNIQSQQVPFQDGGIFLDALLNQRELNVTVAIYDGNNLNKRYELRREMISTLNPKLGEGLLIYTNNYLSKQIHCVPQLPVFRNHNSNDSGTPKASCSFTACNPYWEDLEDKIAMVTKDTQPVIKNEGDVPCSVEANIVPLDTMTDVTILNKNGNQRIKLDGEFEKVVTIDTNSGQKSIYENDYRINLKEISQNEMSKLFRFEEINLFIMLIKNMLYISNNGKDFSCVYVDTDTSSFLYKPYYSKKNEKIYITYSMGEDITGKFLECDIDGKNCKMIDTGLSENIYAVCDSQLLDGLVVVGANGLIAVKQNNAWTTIATSSSAVLVAIEEVIKETTTYLITGGENTLLITTDGTTWTTKSVSSLQDIKYISEIETLFIMGSLSFYSTDFENLIQITQLDSLNAKIEFVSRDRTLLALTKQNKILKSSDVINWAEIYDFQIATLNQIINLVYSAYWNCFYVSGIYLLESVDLQKWNSLLFIDSQRWYDDVYYDKDLGLYLIGASGGVFVVNKETNQVENVYSATNINKFIKVKGFIYAVGTAIIRSSDGINWEELVLMTTENLLCIAYAEDKDVFVASGSGYRTYISQGGLEWTRIQNVWFDCVAYDGKRFIGGEGSAIYESSDGLNWEFTGIGTEEDSYLILDVSAPQGFDYCLLVGVNSDVQEGFIVKYYNSTNYEIINKSEFEGIGKILFNDYYAVFYISAYSSNTEGIYILQDVSDVFQIFPRGQLFRIKEKGIVLIGSSSSPNFVAEIELEKTKNIINQLNKESDISFCLQIGENPISLNTDGGNASASIKYRQRYIGV